ncbi:MAG: lipopolysaccharide kinase InaA family protein [Pseudomonadota bacterium]
MPAEKITWMVDRSCEELFTPALLSDIVERKIVAEEEIKRELAGRCVSRLRLKPKNLPEIYLKEFAIPVSRLFRACFSPPGLNEWRTAQELCKKGIQTYAPIALGIVKRFGIYRKVYFITEAVPDSLTLKEYIETYGPRGKDNRFIDKDLIDLFSDFVSRIRKVGILHTDFHWGNILIRIPDEGIPCFYLIDLHKVKLKPELSNREGLSNLALLNAALLGRVPSRMQIDFLRMYFKGSGISRHTFLRTRDALKGTAEALLLKKWKKQACRCLNENKYFKKIRLNGLTGFAKKGYHKPLLRIAANPHGFFFKAEALILKDSRTTSSLLFPAEDIPPGIHLKRYNEKGIWFILKNFFRSSRAKRVWHAANSLLAREIPTPEPLMYLEKRTCRVLAKSYVVTRMIAQAKDLGAFAMTDFTRLTRRQKLSAIRILAGQIRKMHDRGVRHGDLKAKNILVQQEAGKALQIFFVDLDAAEIHDRLSPHDRCRDVARLNCSFLDTVVLSRTCRLYFLKAYLGKVKKAHLKNTWQTVRRFTEKKMGQSGRRFSNE